MEWVDINKKLPEDGTIFDVWQMAVDPDTGQKTGRRYTHAWLHNGRICHGGDVITELSSITHWMPILKGPEQ